MGVAAVFAFVSWWFFRLLGVCNTFSCGLGLAGGSSLLGGLETSWVSESRWNVELVLAASIHAQTW